MRILILAALLGFNVLGAHAADASKLQRKYSVQSIQTLPVEEFWALGEAQRTELGDLVVLIHRYDSEYGFKRSGLRYCGIFMIGSMDLGARPLAFRLLTVDVCDGVQVIKESNAGSRAFRIEIGSAGAIRVQVTEANEIRVDGIMRGVLPR